MPAKKKLLIALSALLGVFVVGTTGYRVIERDVTFGDAAYMTIITLSTVGLREVWELSPAGRAWTGLVIVFGILVVAVAFSSLQAMIIGGELRGILGRRKMKDEIGKLTGHYIICGYGRMGSLIADNLRRRGEKVVVIDTENQRTAVADEGRLPYVLGDATDEETLRAAGIDRASGLVAALRSDADNVFVALTAAGMRPGILIIARAEYFESESKLKRAGATHVVCPHAIGATRIANLVARPAVAHLVDITSAGSEWEIDEVLVPEGSKLTGRSLRDLRLRERCNAMVVAVRRPDGKTSVNPGPGHVVNTGDSLVVLGPSGIAGTLLDVDATG